MIILFDFEFKIDMNFRDLDMYVIVKFLYRLL